MLLKSRKNSAFTEGEMLFPPTATVICHDCYVILSAGPGCFSQYQGLLTDRVPMGHHQYIYARDLWYNYCRVDSRGVVLG